MAEAALFIRWGATAPGRERKSVELFGESLRFLTKLVTEAMETAYPLTVPLKVDVGWGQNWADAAPAGH